MNQFTIQIANKCVAAQCRFANTAAFCQSYLTTAEPDFTVTISAEDIAFERAKSAREDALEGIAPREYPDSYLETIALQRKIAEKMFDYDTLLFHGSVVAVDGEAFLFTAKSGTGKSTHTRLWREVFGSRAVMVNDDKPFLRIGGDGVIACGTPWNGKHGIGTNISLPLKAICILERGAENRIQEISGKEALFMMLQQSNRPLDRSKMPKYMDLLDALSRKTKFYRMQCNMDPEAAACAYEGMSGKRAK